MKGKISKTGYRKNSADKDNDFNVIPSGRISMKNVEHPVYGIDEFGNHRMMYPGEEVQFGGNVVLEIPMKDEMRHGGQRNIKNRSKTSKNIKSSVNELFLRNYDVYGLPGKHIYDPKAKEGGPIMKYYPIPPHYFVNNHGQKTQPTWYQTGGQWVPAPHPTFSGAGFVPVAQNEVNNIPYHLYKKPMSSTDSADFKLGYLDALSLPRVTGQDSARLQTHVIQDQDYPFQTGAAAGMLRLKQLGGDIDNDYDFDNSEDYDQVEMRKGGMPQWLYEARGRAMNRKMEEGGNINMDKDEFFEEHNRLLKILKHGSKKERLAEYKRQQDEMKEYQTGEDTDMDEMKKGGWIQKAIKHPGRCTPGSPNYDCPKGSPQWNLAQRFKHGDLHKKKKKQFGGVMEEDNFYQTGGGFDAWKAEQLKKGYKLVPNSYKEFYDPKMYTPSSQTNHLAPWTAMNNAPLTSSNYPANTFTYTAPKTATTPKASTYIDTSSNPYHQVSFGQNPMYYDKRTGQTVPAAIVMKERQAQVGPGMKHGGQPCFECGGNTMMEGGGEYLKSLLKAAYRDVTKRQKGGSAPQGYTMDDILAKRNNTFKNYIANNTLYAMAMEEADNLDKLHQMYKQYGGHLSDAFLAQSHVHPAMTTGMIGNNVMGPMLRNDYEFRYGGLHQYQIDGETQEQPVGSGMGSGWDNAAAYGTDPNVTPTPQFHFAASNFDQGPAPGTYTVTPPLSNEQGQIAAPATSAYNYMTQDFQKASFNQGPQTQSKKPNWFQRNAGPGMAEGILTGANFLTAALNARNTRANEKLLKQNTLADKMFQANPTRNRGDYEVNSGTLRPNQYNTSQYAKGGQFNMDQKEIDRLKALGYRVEIIDLID